LNDLARTLSQEKKYDFKSHTLRQSRKHRLLYSVKREREQRNKSLHRNAMSRCNSYKLINEKYSVKLANYQ